MTDVDERAFLEFAGSTADIQLVESFSPTTESLFPKSFAPRELGHWQYFIWNRAFKWQPEIAQATNGMFYVRNRGSAPLIEYDRHNFENKRGLAGGRVYWAKQFASPQPLQYDVAAFSKWFDQIVGWIRKNGHRPKNEGPYFLPDALGKN